MVKSNWVLLFTSGLLLSSTGVFAADGARNQSNNQPKAAAAVTPSNQNAAQAASAGPTGPTKAAPNAAAGPTGPTKAPPNAADSGPFKNNHYVLTGSFPVNGYHKTAPTVVIVDKGSHSTYVLQLQNDKIYRVLTVSNDIGTVDTPTPPGRYTVLYKKMYPRWIPPKTIKHAPVAPYNITHKNPLGVAAIYLNKFDIDLHGTNQPGQIRKSTSHGCVRHSNADILKLYGMVNRGDVVYIVNQFRGKVLNKTDFVTPNVKNKPVSGKSDKPQQATGAHKKAV